MRFNKLTGEYLKIGDAGEFRDDHRAFGAATD